MTLRTSLLKNWTNRGFKHGLERSRSRIGSLTHRSSRDQGNNRAADSIKHEKLLREVGRKNAGQRRDGGGHEDKIQRGMPDTNAEAEQALSNRQAQ